MPNANIEVLSAGERGRMRELTPQQMTAQIAAVKSLVTATSEQLVPNQIDRDASSDKPVVMHSFVAFFRLTESEGLMGIVSVGAYPNDIEGKLILSISYKDDNREGGRRFFELVLPKKPEIVGEDEALRLSTYTPEQLLVITDIVRSGSPIDQKSYNSILEET